MNKDELNLAIVSYSAQGLTGQQIADKLGVSRHMVSNRLNWLRKNYNFSPNLIINEMVQELHGRIKNMNDSNLINLLHIFIPKNNIEPLTKEDVELTFMGDEEQNKQHPDQPLAVQHNNKQTEQTT
jgi:predicted transcriptional regulator